MLRLEIMVTGSSGYLLFLFLQLGYFGCAIGSDKQTNDDMSTGSEALSGNIELGEAR